MSPRVCPFRQYLIGIYVVARILNPKSTQQFFHARVKNALAAEIKATTPIPTTAFVLATSFTPPLLLDPPEEAELPPLDCTVLLPVGAADGVKVADGLETHELAAAVADVLERGLTVPLPANEQA